MFKREPKKLQHGKQFHRAVQDEWRHRAQGLAARRWEKETGADLGLIVHGCLPGSSEFFKVLRFQPKKVNRSARFHITVSQHKALKAHRDLGHYLLYHAPDEDGWGLPPTVRPVFVTFAAADPTKEHGVFVPSDPRRGPREAAKILLRGRPQAEQPLSPPLGC